METAANKPDQSEIRTFGNGGVSFSGKDATNLFRAITLKSSINLYMKTGMIPTRGVTISKMLGMASEYSGKKYKRGENQKAIDDLQIWIDTMKAALPITHEGEK